MRKLILSLFLMTVSAFIWAQTPNQFKYQAVLRNADGTIMEEEDISITASIVKSDLSTRVFEETHHVTTTNQGLIHLNIGSEEDLSAVDWAAETYFLEIKVNGTVIGTTQLLGVPYALHAKTAENVTGEISETDPVFDASAASGITINDISRWNHKLDIEIDPYFNNSIASGISEGDTTNWNNKLSEEVDG